MNIELIVQYFWFLLRNFGLQWALARVKVSEIGSRQYAHRAQLHSKH